MKIAIVTINDPSLEAAKKLLPYLQEHSVSVFNKSQEQKEQNAEFCIYKKVDDILPKAWESFDALIFLMASGAVVRKIAPFLKDKASDPAVLLMSLDLKKVMPLLSGHLGGANALSEEITSKIDGCINFVTTASDQTNRLAFDTFAKEHNFVISNLKALAKISNTILNSKQVQVITYPSIIELIKRFKGYKEENFYFCTIDRLTQKRDDIPTLYITPLHLPNDNLQLHPQEITLGVGMNRGTTASEIADAIERFCFEHGLKKSSITQLASFEAKADEEGLLEYAKDQNLPLKFFNAESINALEEEFSASKATKFFNIKGVAEPASLLASRYKTLFLNKRIYGNVTIAASF